MKKTAEDLLDEYFTKGSEDRGKVLAIYALAKVEDKEELNNLQETYNIAMGEISRLRKCQKEIAKVIKEIENQITSNVFTKCEVYSKNCFHCRFWKQFDENKQILGIKEEIKDSGAFLGGHLWKEKEKNEST